MQKNVFFDLTRVVTQWRKLLNRKVTDTRITQAQWIALLYLQRIGEGITQRDLAWHLAIKNPTLVTLLDALAENDLIERRVSREDHRVRHLHLTEQGTTFMQEINRSTDELREALFEGIAEKDLQAALRTMEKVLENSRSLDKH
ncbi:MarR family winged helix-turn-helix transcriptional regulator [Hydrocarboniclastica marina]|uniref:MarR family transcriptional regulator n=1 Tax=Hydrocarboniclastica marina TaxID=2259620 RepID=A0A4P7XHI7_9ALTE|nr:MarR family transcriptional regulator [Hydrocarboniclastica marina]QCF26225.1 MarR family transcriptional regulator [Hydrocarboniclastica marina]